MASHAPSPTLDFPAKSLENESYVIAWSDIRRHDRLIRNGVIDMPSWGAAHADRANYRVITLDKNSTP